MHASWVEGEDHGLVWAHGLALLGSEVPIDAVSRLWADFAAGGDLASFLKLLSRDTGSDVLSLPSFAIALHTDAGSWQLAARGSLDVRVDDVVVRGEGISTWAERFVADGREVRLGPVSASGAGRPLVAGVVPASVLTWSAGDQAPADRHIDASVVDPSAEQVRGIVPPPHTRRPVESEPVGVENAVTVFDDEAEPAEAVSDEPEHGGPPEADAEIAEPEPEEQIDDFEADGAVAAVEAEGPVAADAATGGQVPGPVDVEPERSSEGGADVPLPEPAVAVAPTSAPGRFARQYGDTQLFSVEDAAVRDGVEVAFISSVPPAVQTPAASDDAVDVEGDHDGNTVLMGVGSPVPPPVFDRASGGDAGVPTVLAVECPTGHANPPHRATCSVCGAPIGGAPRRMARPSLGRLVLPNGESLELTAPVIVGRNPRADRVQGSVLPTLVPLAQSHVSGTHLELRLEEWNVLAVDLHSTNGTFLRRHGEAPVRLGERPELLIEGDVLDLGHGVQLTLEHLR